MCFGRIHAVAQAEAIHAEHFNTVRLIDRPKQLRDVSAVGRHPIFGGNAWMQLSRGTNRT